MLAERNVLSPNNYEVRSSVGFFVCFVVVVVLFCVFFVLFCLFWGLFLFWGLYFGFF